MKNWFLWFAQSRKVQTALATIVSAVLVKCGVNASDALVYGIIATGVAVIAGIAIEDHGTKSGNATADIVTAIIAAQTDGIEIGEVPADPNLTIHSALPSRDK